MHSRSSSLHPGGRVRAEDACSSLQGWQEPGRRCLAFSSWCVPQPAWEVFTQASSDCCLQ